MRPDMRERTSKVARAATKPSVRDIGWTLPLYTALDYLTALPPITFELV